MRSKSRGKLIRTGAVLLLAASSIRCAAGRFFSNYMPPDLEARLSANSGGVEGGVKAEFNGTVSKTHLDLSGGSSESTIAGTGNKVEDSRFTSDFNIIVRNKLSVPVIYESSGTVITTPAGVKESDLDSTFLAAGLGYEWGFQNPRFLRGRVFFGDSLDKTIVGDISTDRSGFFIDGHLGAETLSILPLLSLDKYKVDAGASAAELSELQAGLAVQLDSFTGNLRASLGGYFVHAEEDNDNTDTVVGNLDVTYSRGRRLLGATASYDGNLGNLGVYTTFGRGNATQSAKAIIKSLREIQRLTLTERGIPESIRERRRVESVQTLQDVDNLLCLVGFRQQYNPVKDEVEPVPYAYLAFPINRDRKITGAVSYGPAFEPYPEDAVDSMWGIFAGFPIGEKGRIHAGYEKAKFLTIDDKGAFTLKAVISLK